MLPVSNVDECTQYIIINTQYNETVCFLIKCTIKWQIAQRQIHPCHAHPGTIYRFANLLFYCKIIPPTNQFGESAVEHARHETGGSNLGKLTLSGKCVHTHAINMYVNIKWEIKENSKQNDLPWRFSQPLCHPTRHIHTSPHTRPRILCVLSANIKTAPGSARNPSKYRSLFDTFIFPVCASTEGHENC